jgi:glyoxylase-like metal-dependent hydrolase (beta-lactamase superfamily II)
MSPTDAGVVRRFWTEEYLNQIRQFYLKCALPDNLNEQLNARVGQQGLAITSHPQTEDRLKDGETVKLGNDLFTVIATPGHAEGMVCFYQPEEKLLFSADHILPHITPNVTYWPLSDPNPLQSYLDALNKMKQFDVERVLPSHGEPFVGVQERIEQIIQHHEKRIDQLLDHIATWTSVYQACCHLFGNKNLNVHDLRFAIGETVAHLEYLVHQGVVNKLEDQSGWWLYQRA